MLTHTEVRNEAKDTNTDSNTRYYEDPVLLFKWDTGECSLFTSRKLRPVRRKWMSECPLLQGCRCTVSKGVGEKSIYIYIYIYFSSSTVLTEGEEKKKKHHHHHQKQKNPLAWTAQCSVVCAQRHSVVCL